MRFNEAMGELASMSGLDNFQVAATFQLVGSIGGQLSDQTVRWIGRKIYRPSIVDFKGEWKEYKQLKSLSKIEKIGCALLVLSAGAVVGGLVGLTGGSLLTMTVTFSSNAGKWFKGAIFAVGAGAGVFKAAIYLIEPKEKPVRERSASFNSSSKPHRNNYKSKQPPQTVAQRPHADSPVLPEKSLV